MYQTPLKITVAVQQGEQFRQKFYILPVPFDAKEFGEQIATYVDHSLGIFKELEAPEIDE